MVAAPASTVLEECIEDAFEEPIRAGWPAAADEVEPAPGRRASRGDCAQAVSADGVLMGPADEPVVFPVDVPESVLALLDQVESLVETITAIDPASLPGAVAAEVSQRIHVAVGRLEAQRLGCIARTEVEGSWRSETMHSFASWLEKAENLSKGLAQRTVAAARAVSQHLPATGAAARAGSITGEHVGIMVKATRTQELREALASPVIEDSPAAGDTPVAGDTSVCTWEENLLRCATWRVEKFNQVVKTFTLSADPAAQEKAFKDADEREFLQISPTLGGSQINGFVTAEHAQLITTALRAVAGVPSAADTLLPADLRKVDALVDLCQQYLDAGTAGKGANVRPHLSVHITWEEFTRVYEATHTDTEDGAEDVDGPGAAGESAGDASTTGSDDTGSRSWSPKTLEARLKAGYATWEDGTGPIPDAVLRRIACDGEMTRIIFGPDSQILNISRTRRTFTKEHRRAIIARDRTCVWPGCTAPPRVCEIHHAIRHWADNGDTTPSNGALLCRHHHHRVDGENINMTHANGTWHIDVPGTYQAGDI